VRFALPFYKVRRDSGIALAAVMRSHLQTWSNWEISNTYIAFQSSIPEIQQ